MASMNIENPECVNCKKWEHCRLATFDCGSKCSRYVMDSYIKHVLYGEGQKENEEE